MDALIHTLDVDGEKEAEQMLATLLSPEKLPALNLPLFFLIMDSTLNVPIGCLRRYELFTNELIARQRINTFADFLQVKTRIVNLSCNEVGPFFNTSSSIDSSFKIRINPCPACGFGNDIPFKFLEDPQGLRHFWAIDSSFRYAQFQRLFLEAENLFNHAKFRESLSMLNQINNGIDPGVELANKLEQACKVNLAKL